MPLKVAIENARALMPKDIAPNLFHTRRGKSYVTENDTTSGFDSIWRRWMLKCLDQGLVEERFSEHDLRAKTASDADTVERATELLGSGKAVVKKHYRRKGRVVKPHDASL
ncbi:MAG: hypothetical protein AAF387_20785 [Pseudomonadota bacterium]